MFMQRIIAQNVFFVRDFDKVSVLLPHSGLYR